MEYIKNPVVYGLLVALLVALAFWVFQPTQVIRDSGDNVGAVASPNLPSPWFRFGGVERWAYKDESLTQASTTLCAIQSPSATSTLVSGGIRLETGSSTQLNVGIGKGTTKFATTTAFNDANLSANSQGTLVAQDPEGASFDEANVFGPDEWFIVQAFGGITGGDDGGGFTPEGVCQAVWERI